MVYFYSLLAMGTKTSRLPRSFLPQVEYLRSLGVLKQNGECVALQAPYILALVQDSLEGGALFAKSLDSGHKEDFLIQDRTAWGKRASKRDAKRDTKRASNPAHRPKRGDIILAIETKGKNRGIKARMLNKPRARLLEILYMSKPYALAVLILASELKNEAKQAKRQTKHGAKHKPKISESSSQEKILALELRRKKRADERDCLLDLKVSQKSLRALPRHCVIKVELSSGQIVEVLGSLEDAHIDEALALASHKLATHFSQEALDFAAAFGEKLDVGMYPAREDLRHLDFCVIDPSDAKDHDDAIYFDVKTRTLYVAIADVSEYVSPSSALDKEARERGFSLYFPHKVLPMLPHTLSSGICSLKQGEDRLAMVWKITLDKNARVASASLVEAMIRSKANVSYEEVQGFLDSKKSQALPKGVAKWLQGYVPFVKRLREERLKQGCEFESHEIRLRLDENAQISSWHKEAHNLAHSVIEESMLLANIQSATMLECAREGGYITHGLYRIHPRPKAQRLDELLFTLREMGFELELKRRGKRQVSGQKNGQAENTEEPSDHAMIAQIQSFASTLPPYMREVIDTLIIRSLAKATYSTQNIGHFGLGFGLYTHFTSPIRRYGDLITHRILKALPRDLREQGGLKEQGALKKQAGRRLSPPSEAAKLHFITQDLHAIAQELNLKERQIAHIEQDFILAKITRLGAMLLESARQSGEELIIRAALLEECRAIALETIPQARIILTPHNESAERVGSRASTKAVDTRGITPLSLVYVRIFEVDLLRGQIYGEVLKGEAMKGEVAQGERAKGELSESALDSEILSKTAKCSESSTAKRATKSAKATKRPKSRPKPIKTKEER